MNKVASTTLILALAAAAYTASAWYLGKEVEAQITSQYSNLIASQPYLKIVERDYQRGIFSSKETVTLSLFDLSAMEKLNTSTDTTDENRLLMTFHSRIQHGPFPGFSTLAAATSKTELVLDVEAREEVVKVMGDQLPYTQQTEIRFDGSGTATFSSPKFESIMPDQSGEISRISWEGIEGKMDFSPGLSAFTMHMKAPKLEISDEQGGQMRFTDVVIEGDQQQIFPDLPYMYSGTSRFSIGEVSMAGIDEAMEPVSINNLVYDIDLPLQGDHLDVLARMGIDKLSVGDESFGPIHMDFSFKHLHARALAEINQKLMGIYSDPNLLNGGTEEIMEGFQSALMTHAETLLTQDPEFSLDRVSFANSDGEAKLAARVKLSGATLEMLANPLMLLSKVEASGDLSLSETMVVKLLQNPPFPTNPDQAAASTEEIKQKGEMAVGQFQQQVAMLMEQGYLEREGEIIKTTMAFKEGQLTVNGKPFNPAAMGQPPAHQ
ncbi:MAG: YdgA family protein [Candidatus Thiodiazotropha sp. (ex Monitilora ramsayi)]|nr:YdgA family protein [Candidatus Thiodiazotropha sp. (ex Monitilora ramsayi)]